MDKSFYTSSAIFKSGLLAGQSKTFTWEDFRKFVTFRDLWTGELSSWKKYLFRNSISWLAQQWPVAALYIYRNLNCLQQSGNWGYYLEDKYPNKNTSTSTLALSTVQFLRLSDITAPIQRKSFFVAECSQFPTVLVFNPLSNGSHSFFFM